MMIAANKNVPLNGVSYDQAGPEFNQGEEVDPVLEETMYIHEPRNHLLRGMPRHSHSGSRIANKTTP
jgi:hypothetical protein